MHLCRTRGTDHNIFQGLPQYIHIAFDSPVYPEVINLTFQGGFAGKRCSILASPLAGNDIADSENLRSGTQLTELCTIYPEDVNRKQTFEISECPTAITLLRIVFEESSDLFGRITIYDLQIEGRMEK